MFKPIWDLMNVVADAAYKLSDSPFVLIFDVERVVAQFDLDRAPTTFSQAFLQYVFFSPVPTEAYEFIPDFPAIAAQQPAFIPTISYEGVGYLSSLMTQDPPVCHRGYYLFHNILRDDQSCATRLLRVLGLHNLEGERYYDISKVGMHRNALNKTLASIWVRGVHTSRSDLKVADADVNAVVRYLSNEVDMALRPKRDVNVCNVLIHVFSDHVAFAVRSDYLDMLRLNALAHPVHENFRSLTDCFPHTTGRAGGKVFVFPSNILSLGRPSQLQNACLNWFLSLKGKVDWQHVMPCALLLLPYIDICGPTLLHFILVNRSFLSVDTAEFAKIMKGVHASIRTTFRLPNYMRSSSTPRHAREFARTAYGLETLAGRSELLKLDINKEFAMRSVDPATRAYPSICTPLGAEFSTIRFSFSKFHQLIPKLARGMVDTLLADDIQLYTLHEFFQSRLFWGASGGAPGATVTWDGQEKLRMNKRGALLSLKETHIREILKSVVAPDSRTPVQWSVNAIKFESGKLRSILNTILEHYVIQGYLSHHIDSNATHNSWYSVGQHNPARIANTLRRICDLKRHVGFMWDYSDFNINHIFTLMAQQTLAQVDGLLARAHTSGRSAAYIEEAARDLKQAAAYVVLARFNTYLSDHETGVVARTARGLQSGERQTSRINSDSNYIDTQLVRHVSRDMFGRQLLTRITEHSGDDAFETAYSYFDGMLAAALYNLTGSAGQVHKVLMSFPQHGGGLGEYLRVSYDASNHVVNGYPVRALMGFIHGEFFSNPLPQPFERAAAFITQFAKLRRRGADLPQAFVKSVIRTNCSLTFTVGTDKRFFRPDLDIVRLPAILGGVGIEDTEKGLLAGPSPITFYHSRGATGFQLLIVANELLVKFKTALRARMNVLMLDDHIHSLALALGAYTKGIETGWWDDYYAIGKQEYERALTQLPTPGTVGSTLVLSAHPQMFEDISTAIGIVPASKTGDRLNRASHAAILRSLQHVVTLNNPSNLFSVVYDLTRDEQHPAMCTYRRASNAKFPSIPLYEMPKINARETVRSAKNPIPDFNILHKAGVTNIQPLYEEIAKSTLSGAWPKHALNESLADYGRQLAEWAHHNRFSTGVMAMPPLPDLARIRTAVKSKLMETLSIKGQSGGVVAFRENSLGFPATSTLRHSYNASTALVKPIGATISKTLTLLFDAAKGSDRLDKIINALQDRHEIAPVPALTTKLGHLRAISRALTTPRARANFADYFEGGWSLIPPVNTGWSADILTLVRDLTLNLVESADLAPITLPNLCSMDRLRAVIALHYLETVINAETVDYLQTLIPGVIIRD
ncbi:putative RNA-dependent RNA polymerase [Cryphonectria carpinicola fusagravirus 1]|uniref:RNA-directed RNA polymerase n=1 Tax=Cryphonectria carpinicola fusagravirus 1 TaxID=2879941 RepID=A0A8J9S2Q4_9VIRU|nr:putative RNA-dependent RNA polymerase [Cryphonectria carpinicola fusagravirus 1]